MTNFIKVKFDGLETVKLSKWKVKKGATLSVGIILFIYNERGTEKKFKCVHNGLVTKLLAKENDYIDPGQVILEFQYCLHTTVMKDLCAECGMDLRKTGENNFASVSMIHSVPELKVSVEQAQKLGKADEEKLLKSRKLVLLVDLDQTLIHTTNNHNDQSKFKDVISFSLHSGPHLYFTKLRPFTKEFLESISKLYELHICTFGARLYAHKIAEILDPDKKLFSHRILSRDECFDPQLKTGNLQALFPCGDSMVCIIDDREDVWNYLPNLVTVKPYSFFKNIGDLNSPNKEKDEMLARAARAFSNKNEKNISSENQDCELKDLDKELNDDDGDNNNDEVKNEKKDSNIKKDDDNLIVEKVEEDDVQVEKPELNEDLNSENVEVKKKEDIEEKSCLDHDENQSFKNIEKENKNTKVNLIEKNKDIDNDNNNKIIIDDNDDYLLYLLDILKKIHRRFYAEYDEIMKYSAEDEQIKIPDLKTLVPSIRKEIFRGINIVFTGLIPTKMIPEQSKLWVLAKTMGANVSRDIVLEGSPLERTTHLIASNLGTAKAQKALKTKRIWVVNPLWLYTCSERWEKVEEKLFTLKKEEDFGNPEKRKGKVTFDEELFLTRDLVRVSNLDIKNDFKINGANFRDVNSSLYDGKINKSNCNKQNNQPSTSIQERKYSNEDLEPHNMLEYSPLSAFTESDLQLMDKEVDDACSENDHLSSSSSEEDDFNLDLSKDSRGQKRKRTNEDSSDEDEKKDINEESQLFDMLDDTRDSFAEDSNGSNVEEMGAALERDFLS